MDCDCWPLVCRSGHANNFGITYHMQCGYCNSIHCPWQCLIFIHFNQNHAATLYLRKYPNAPAGNTEPLDTTFYDRQTMFVVPNEVRNVTHSNHVCVISTAYVHANHNGFCKNGPHCMWEAFCALHPYALNFKRCEIQKWLVDRQINCMHIDPHTGEQTNQLGVMVHRCKRYCERLMRAIGLDDRHGGRGKGGGKGGGKGKGKSGSKGKSNGKGKGKEAVDSEEDEGAGRAALELEVLKAADLFQAEGLLKHCLEGFRGGLTVHTVVEQLVWAHKRGPAEAQAVATEFFVAHGRAVRVRYF
jgi:hypothetical protein